jgi:hypothetical protein
VASSQTTVPIRINAEYVTGAGAIGDAAKHVEQTPPERSDQTSLRRGGGSIAALQYPPRHKSRPVHQTGARALWGASAGPTTANPSCALRGTTTQAGQRSQLQVGRPQPCKHRRPAKKYAGLEVVTAA